MKHRLATVSSIFALSLFLGGCDFSRFMPKSTYTTVKATVLKVYSVSDSAGYKYNGYVVDRGGVEIVVSDPLGATAHKVGDVIEYLDQKIEMHGGTKVLNFTLLK